jgi:lipopolysaccharide assembly outer membrane protein LptD (OstA)
MTGWRVIEPPGRHPLQGSFQTTNTEETLKATFLLHVSKSSDAVKTKSCGIEDTAQKRTKKEQNPNLQLATFHTLLG